MSWMVAPILFDGLKSSSFSPSDSFESINENVHFLADGSITTLPGWNSAISAQTASTSWGDPTVYYPHCAFHHVLSTGANGWLLYKTNAFKGTNYENGTPTIGRFYYANYGASTYTPFFLSANYTAIDTNMVQLNNKVFVSFIDGVTQPRTYYHLDANLSAVTGCPDGKYCEVHYDRIFLANSNATPSRLWWSSIADSRTWGTATDYIDFDNSKNGVITGIKSYNGDLYVFKNVNANKITGSDFDAVSGNFSKTTLEGVPGCLSHKSIIVADGLMYWLSPSGFVSYNGFTVSPIGVVAGVDTRVNNGYIYSDTVQATFDPLRHLIFWRDNLTTWSYNTLLKKWSTYATPLGQTYTSAPISYGDYSGCLMYFGGVTGGIYAYNSPLGDSHGEQDFAGNELNFTLATNHMKLQTFRKKNNISFVLHHPLATNSGRTLRARVYYDYSSTVTEDKYIDYNYSEGNNPAGIFGKATKIYMQNSECSMCKLMLSLSANHQKPIIYGVFAEYELNDENIRIPEWRF